MKLETESQSKLLANMCIISASIKSKTLIKALKVYNCLGKWLSSSALTITYSKNL